MSFFDLQLLITLLISSDFPCKQVLDAIPHTIWSELMRSGMTSRSCSTSDTLRVTPYLQQCIENSNTNRVVRCKSMANKFLLFST